MLENVLKRRGAAVRMTVKSVIAAGLIAAAALLPLLVHALAGATGGATWLPMYLPVLIGGCLLGLGFGAVVGVCSPLASYFVSQAILGSPMPVAAKLPYMIVELAVFGLVAGLFSKKIATKPLFAFPAVLSAQIIGKLVGAGIAAAAMAIRGTAGYHTLWAPIQMGLPGLCMQAVLVPLIIIVLNKVLKNDAAR